MQLLLRLRSINISQFKTRRAVPTSPGLWAQQRWAAGLTLSASIVTRLWRARPLKWYELTHTRNSCLILTSVLTDYWLGPSSSSGSPFRDEITLGILQLQESNRLEILKRRWWEGGQCPKEEDHRAKGGWPGSRWYCSPNTDSHH